jgi:hypothetical protein
MNIFQVNADVATPPDIAPQPDEEPPYAEDEVVDVAQDEFLDAAEANADEFQDDLLEATEDEKEDPDAPQQLSLF